MKWKVLFKTSRKTVGGTTYIVLVQTLNHAQSINQSINQSKRLDKTDRLSPTSQRGPTSWRQARRLLQRSRS